LGAGAWGANIHADGGFVIGCYIFQVTPTIGADSVRSWRRLLIRFPTMQKQLVDFAHGMAVGDFVEDVGEPCLRIDIQDTDHDGYVELGEGVPVYGPIIVPLTGFDSAETSTVDYTHVFNLLDPMIYGAGYSRADLLGIDFSELDLRELVIHGLTVPSGPGAGTPGEVDGTNGYLAVLPVASGEIMAAPEPSTWAMMFLGLGGIAALRLRSKRSAVKAFA
jgi:hypothetical protein